MYAPPSPVIIDPKSMVGVPWLMKFGSPAPNEGTGLLDTGGLGSGGATVTGVSLNTGGGSGIDHCGEVGSPIIVRGITVSCLTATLGTTPDTPVPGIGNSLGPATPTEIGAPPTMTGCETRAGISDGCW